MTEFGSLALIDMGQDEDENGKNIRLPGVRKGDHSSRHFKPEILVTCVRFSPTGKNIKQIIYYLTYLPSKNRTCMGSMYNGRFTYLFY